MTTTGSPPQGSTSGAASSPGASLFPPQTLLLDGLREDEVAFVRATAAAWRLGHAAEDEGQGGGGGAAAEGGSKRGGKGVRVWLPPVRLNSTHDLAAGMSVAPESSAPGDGDGDGEGEEEEEGGGGVAGGGGDGEEDGFDAGEFACKVCYAVMPSGVVTVDCDVSMPEHWPVIPR